MRAGAVARLAQEAGRRLKLPPDQVLMLRRAGFVHGFGRLGVSNSIWDRPGPLSAGEWERVRLYPYLTERMLRQSAALAPLGDIAVQVRERLDGSGYPRGLPGGAIPMLARVLGAADVYASMREPRPYRPARSAEEAVAEVRVGPPRRCSRCSTVREDGQWKVVQSHASIGVPNADIFG
jgi:HD-GYP domain-containing protein (c-di-GMP phosphodiesterase class II)